MSIVQIIPAANYANVRWKNGGGTTSEIAVFPPGAGMDDFLWRLSMAQVETPGPFSAFHGVDRTLAVIEGALTLAGPDFEVTLDDASAPFRFDGHACVHGHPLCGSVRDLNAMVRRGAYSASMAWLRPGDLAMCAGTGFIIAAEAQTCPIHRLGKLDCALIDAPVRVNGRALFVDFSTA